MDRTIESIWNQGLFMGDENAIAKLNEFYNRKSSSLVERLTRRMETETNIFIPLAVFMLIFNYVLGNDFIWGVVSAAATIPWYFLGRQQVKTIRNVEADSNCYAYLKAVKHKIKLITRFNQRFTLAYLIIILLPMLTYTIINNQEKTLGQLFDVVGLDWSIYVLFAFLPFMLLLAFVVTEISIQKSKDPNRSKIEALIRDMEELKGRCGSYDNQ